MDSNLLFTSALGLQAPWQVSDIRFSRAYNVCLRLNFAGPTTYLQSLIDDGKFASLTEITRSGGIDRAYVSRMFKLTKVSPVILERAFAGKVTMEALMAMDGFWVQQEA